MTTKALRKPNVGDVYYSRVYRDFGKIVAIDWDPEEGYLCYFFLSEEQAPDGPPLSVDAHSLTWREKTRTKYAMSYVCKGSEWILYESARPTIEWE